MLPGVVPFPPDFAARYRAKGYWQDKSLAQEFAPVFQSFADRVALLNMGRLAGIGTPADILRPLTLEPTFDVHVAVDLGSDGHPVVLPLRARRP